MLKFYKNISIIIFILLPASFSFSPLIPGAFEAISVVVSPGFSTCEDGLLGHSFWATCGVWKSNMCRWPLLSYTIFFLFTRDSHRALSASGVCRVIRNTWERGGTQVKGIMGAWAMAGWCWGSQKISEAPGWSLKSCIILVYL